MFAEREQLRLPPKYLIRLLGINVKRFLNCGDLPAENGCAIHQQMGLALVQSGRSGFAVPAQTTGGGEKTFDVDLSTLGTYRELKMA